MLAASSRSPKLPRVPPEDPAVDYTTVRELREHSRSFERISAYRDGPGILFENGVPEMLRGLSVDYVKFSNACGPFLG
jgi:hypothetical protein